jgi:putative phage-type endonuclease
MQLVKIKQRTKEWLEWRSEKVTASDAPIVMGVSPYKKIDKLWTEKIKCYESPPNMYMKRGNDLEEIALEKFEAETGLTMFPMVAVHDTMNWMAASFDGVTLEQDAIVEIKCNGNKNHSLAEYGKIPDFHNAQIQHQLHVSGLEFAYYFSFDGNSGIILEVKRDQSFIEIMLEKEFEFWNCLQNLTPPTVTPKTRKHKSYAG